MKKMKLTFSLIAVIIVFAVALSSCGGNKEQVESSNEITWYMPKAIENVSDQTLVENEVNRLINEKLDANLKFKLIDSSVYDQKMNVIVSSGESYDICFTTSWSNSYFKNVKQNAFLELSDLLKKYGQDILAKNDKRVMDAMTTDGKIYAIPSQNPLSNASARALKKDLVEKYNLDYKNAVELKDLEPWFEQIKQNEPGIVPVLQLASPVSSRYADDSIPGLRYDEQEGKFVKAYDIPEIIEDYRTRHDFYQKGYFAKDAATKKDYMADAKSGKYAVMNSTYYTEDGSKSTGTYGFDCVETYLGNTIITTPGIMTAMNAIGVNSKNPEKAMQVLNLIWQDPNISNTIAYGIEGVHYQVDKSNTEERSIIPKSGKEQTWAIWHNWIGPLWDQWDSSWNSTESLNEMRHNNEIANVSGVFGFIFDNEPVKTEYAQVSAAINEFKNIFGTGSMPDFDDYLEKANIKLREAGIDTLLEEANRQLEEWKKNK